MSTSSPIVKMYSDFKSPYAYLAFLDFFDLEIDFNVVTKWKPFQLRIKGKGQRSVYSEFKVRYSYMDVRRWANKRGGLMIRGPQRIFDTKPALIGGLFAESEGRLREYGNTVYDLFFKRELDTDDVDAIGGLVASLGMSEEAYRNYFNGQGEQDYEVALAEAMDDHVFGVPLFIYEGEQFWGYDRMGLLRERLAEAGLVKYGERPGIIS